MWFWIITSPSFIDLIYNNFIVMLKKTTIYYLPQWHQIQNHVSALISSTTALFIYLLTWVFRLTCAYLDWSYKYWS
jgi:hypothetical protein